MAGEGANWWQTGIIYQIYPRSFQDSNRDGVGDLRGIIHRLPYLVELGIDAIWLSPIFKSPMADFGYDIADYIDVDPLFGDLADLDSLIDAAHRSQLKIILDLVPNHTSDQHPWFVESKASRNNPKRDWFIWRDPAAEGAAPNNWLSEFGGSAWEFDASTNQYYYHTFLSAQPDLNWRNPAVRSAIHEVMRFWLRRGIDGFRVDAVWYLLKDNQFRDNPVNPDYRSGGLPRDALIPLYTADLPEVHDAISGMRQVLNEFSDRVLLGEIYLPIERLMAYYGRDLGGVHFPYNFALLTAKWNALSLAKLIEEYEAALPSGGWPNWVLGNHDRPRLATRIGLEQVRVAAMLLMTLRGTPTLYYGDEIGMEQVAILPEQVRDPFERNVPGIGIGRDGCRTPMQWDATEFAGFSDADPWLPVADNFREVNIASSRNDIRSLYSLYRRLICLRRKHDALTRGAYNPLLKSENILLFRRDHSNERVLIALNMGSEPFAISTLGESLSGRVLLSSVAQREGEQVSGTIDLSGNEGLLVLVDRDAAENHGQPFHRSAQMWIAERISRTGNLATGVNA
jgi:alpha-glucosidase